MPEKIHLIVNADDFGLTRGVSEGIIEAHERGIVTSTSLMVRQPYAGESAVLARTCPRLGVGLHLDLTEWVYENDDWRCLYERVPLTDEDAVRSEVEAQIGIFLDLCGIPPTHIDSHQHIARDGLVGEVVGEIAAAQGWPVRHRTPGVRYCGEFYGQSAKGYAYHEGVSPAQLLRIVAELPGGVTELCCHPGRADGLESVYREERELEIQALCDHGVRAAIIARDVVLMNFREFSGR